MSKEDTSFWEKAVINDYKVGHLILTIIGAYIAYRIVLQIIWKYKNYQVHQYAQEVRRRRDASSFDFNIHGLDIDFIISLDVKSLRQELIKGTFTSVNLVNVFGSRCQKIAR